jgi:hypothetical protein
LSIAPSLIGTGFATNIRTETPLASWDLIRSPVADVTDITGRLARTIHEP